MPIARHRPRRFHSRFHSPAVTSYGRADSFSVDYIIHVLKAPITNLSSALSPLLFFFFTSLLFSFSFLFIASFELACPVTRRGDFVSFDLSKREEGREGGRGKQTDTLRFFVCARSTGDFHTPLFRHHALGNRFSLREGFLSADGGMSVVDRWPTRGSSPRFDFACNPARRFILRANETETFVTPALTVP